jgi:hypothetical protein
MIRFYKYVVLAGILCGSLACAPSKTTRELPETSNCCGPQIIGICLAYYPDLAGSTYITRQTHEFCPCGRSLQIQAQEPQGQWLWRLCDDVFSTVSPDKSSPQNNLYDRSLSLAVFYSMASATELLPLAANPSAEPVKLEGQWYIPFVHHTANGATVTLLKSKDTGKFDLVKIQDNKMVLLARSYNFQYNQMLQKNIPRTIDVFNMADGLSAKKMVLQLQYVQIEPRN